jgi:hypothetical protein
MMHLDGLARIIDILIQREDKKTINNGFGNGIYIISGELL